MNVLGMLQKGAHIVQLLVAARFSAPGGGVAIAD
jgi:hypothetical protein